MIRINQLKVKEGSDRDHIIEKAAKKAGIPPFKIKDLIIIKKSRDARKKNNILDVYSLAVKTAFSAAKEKEIIKKAKSGDISFFETRPYELKADGKRKQEKRPVIAGFGPAGIFLAYVLSQKGYRPIVIERGQSAEKRKESVEAFFESGALDTESNVLFGEGGAGAFSDGKLNTLIKDEKGRGRFVLETLVKFGADERILYDSKPHIGTDRLLAIIPGIRQEIIKNGGDIRFNTCLKDFESTDGRIGRVLLNDGGSIETDALFLCLGHSARDTFTVLKEEGVYLEAKAFAIGVRIEHKRSDIDNALHTEKASYKLTHKCIDGRGVYTFCMCPGGFVINSSSENGGLCVNGMSYSGRSGENSNSALVVTVNEDDYGGDKNDPLRGMEFQRRLERKAYSLLDGRIPYQRYGDLKEGRKSTGAGRVQPSCKGAYGFSDLGLILPDFVIADIREGIEAFDKKIRGFADDDALLSGIESRTSSPVRIRRDESFQSNIAGIYPVGEGAGYAGGIMSAAVDALKCAEAYAAEYKGDI